MTLAKNNLEVRHFQFLMVPIGLLFLSCDNDDYPHAEIPSIVLNEFFAHFPNALDVDFEKNGLNYEVDFEINEIDRGAIISAEGILIKEKKEVQMREIPLEVQNGLEKFEKNKIGELEIVKTLNDTFYQVQLKRFGFDKKIILDKAGKENKEESFWD